MVYVHGHVTSKRFCMVPIKAEVRAHDEPRSNPIETGFLAPWFKLNFLPEAEPHTMLVARGSRGVVGVREQAWSFSEGVQ